MKPTRDTLVFQLEDMITDRDRWKARCEAAERVVDHIVDHLSGFCEIYDQFEAYYESWEKWQRIKSEMEAE